MLDVRVYDSVRKPLNEADTLPPSSYNSQEFYDREVEAIFHKKWLPIGRTDEWKKPGDYKAYDRFGYSFLVVLNQEHELRAYANTCRHRGSMIVQGEGNTRGLRCPYHSWVYNLDGDLVAAPGMENAIGFDKCNYSLRGIQLDVWQTFVFVNFDPDCKPLLEQIGDLDSRFAPYDFANVETIGSTEYVVKANWKAYVENSMEWLHHPTVHKSSILGRVETVERVAVTGAPGDYVMIQSRANGVSRAVMGDAKTFPAVSNLSGIAREGAQYALLLPYVMIGCDVDSIWFKQMIPEGPNQVRNIVTYCFHREIRERPDFDEIMPNYVNRFRTVVEEDNRAMELQCAGLALPLASTGRFSDREILVHKIDNWILDQMFGADR